MIAPRSVLTALTLGLAACGEWPDVPSPTGAEVTGTWPVLQPLSELVAPPDNSQEEEAASEALLERAEALQRRAAILRTPVPDEDAFDALRDRLAG